jgi:hypothetical protein
MKILKALHTHTFYPFNHPRAFKGVSFSLPPLRENKLLNPYATFGCISNGSFLVGPKLMLERGVGAILHQPKSSGHLQPSGKFAAPPASIARCY